MKHGEIVEIVSGGLNVGNVGVVRRFNTRHGHTIDLLNKKMNKVIGVAIGLRSMNLKKLQVNLKECPCDECDYQRQLDD